jgi:hypothetical protein
MLRAKRAPEAEALRADHADDARSHQVTMAFEGNQRRRVGDGGQSFRVIGLAQAQQPGAGGLGGGPFVLGFRFGANHDGFLAPAAFGEFRQIAKRRGSVLVARHQLHVGDGADVLGADQAQTVETLGVGNTGVCEHGGTMVRNMRFVNQK